MAIDNLPEEEFQEPLQEPEFQEVDPPTKEKGKKKTTNQAATPPSPMDEKGFLQPRLKVGADKGKLSELERSLREYKETSDAAAGAEVTGMYGNTMGGDVPPMVSDVQQKAKVNLPQKLKYRDEQLKLNKDYSNTLAEQMFGNVNDILGKSEKFKRFVLKNENGMDVVDEGAITKELERMVAQDGGGRYASEHFRRNILEAATQNLMMYSAKDKINARLSPYKVDRSNIAKAEFKDVLDKQKSLAEAELTVENELYQRKVADIQNQFKPALETISTNAQYLYQQVQQSVVEKYKQQGVGGFGVSNTFLNNRINEEVNNTFNQQYGEQIKQEMKPVVDMYVTGLKDSFRSLVNARTRIIKEQQIVLTERQKAFIEKEKQKAASDTKDIQRIFNEEMSKTYASYSANGKAIANTFAAMSGTGMTTGAAFTGKIFGDSFAAGLGRLQSNTAFFLNSLGFEAKWINDMKYSGMTMRSKNQMETPDGDLWFTPGYWAKALGESAPTMLPGIATSLLTGNPFVGALIGTISEGTDISGGVADEIAKNTGDWGKAREGATEAFVRNIPTYLLEAITQRSLLKLMRGGDGFVRPLLAESISQGVQEGAQTGLIELPLTTGKPISETLPSSETKEAVGIGFGMGVVTGGLLGASGRMFKALTTQSLTPNAQQQLIAAAILKNGKQAAVGSAQLDGMVSGVADEQLAADIEEVERIAASVDEAKLVLGLDDNQAKVYASVVGDITKMEQQMPSLSPTGQEMQKQKIAEKKTELDNLITGKTPTATVNLGGGIELVSTVEGVDEMLQDPSVVEGLRDGSVTIVSADVNLNDKVKAAIAGQPVEQKAEEVKPEPVQQQPVVGEKEVADEIRGAVAEGKFPGLNAEVLANTSDKDVVDFIYDQATQTTNDPITGEPTTARPLLDQTFGKELVDKVIATREQPPTPRSEVRERIKQMEVDLEAPVASTQSAPVSNKQVKSLVAKLQKVFPKTTVVMDKAGFDEAMQDAEAKSFTDKGGVVYGRVKDGKLYLNPEYPNFNTPVHEFGHLWIQMAKDQMPKVHAKGLELIRDSEYMADPNTDPEEALATAIGDRGAKFVSEAAKNAFRNWWNRLVKAIAKFMGIRQLADEQIDALNLDDFLNMAATDVLTGEPVTEVGEVDAFSAKKHPLYDKLVTLAEAYYEDAIEGGASIPEAKAITEAKLKDRIRQLQDRGAIKEGAEKLLESVNDIVKQAAKDFSAVQRDRTKKAALATPQGQEVVDAANAEADLIVQENKGKKTGKITTAQALARITSKAKEVVQKIYDEGRAPADIAYINMLGLASEVAADAVNGAFPSAKKISAQETETTTMTVRQWINNAVSNQLRAIEAVKDRSKAAQSIVRDVMKELAEKYGKGIKLSMTNARMVMKEVNESVFSRFDDFTALQDIADAVSAIIEKAARKQILSETANLIDKLRARYEGGMFTGDSRVAVLEQLLPVDALSLAESTATVEEIQRLNAYLRELTQKATDTNNLNAAIGILQSFQAPQQKATITEYDSVLNKARRINTKLQTGEVDFEDYKTIVALEKAVNDLKERKGLLENIDDEQRAKLEAEIDNINSLLPKPIDELMQEAEQRIKDEAIAMAAQFRDDMQANQSILREKITNPYLYRTLIKLYNSLTDSFIESLPVKEQALLTANIGEIFRGNVNNTTFEFINKQAQAAIKVILTDFATKISQRRPDLDTKHLTGILAQVWRAIADVDAVRSPEVIANHLDLLALHAIDVQLFTGKDEFGVGPLESGVFAKMATAVDAAMNGTLGNMSLIQDAMNALNDSSNRSAIKQGLRMLNEKLGIPMFKDKRAAMFFRKLVRGSGDSFMMQVSTRMTYMIMTQLDHLANMEEGQTPSDIVLIRNILEQSLSEYDGTTTMADVVSKSVAQVADAKHPFDIIAYGMLTEGGTKRLSDFTKEELLDKLSPKQKEAMSLWRQHIEKMQPLAEAVMTMRGKMLTFLKDYAPRRVITDSDFEFIGKDGSVDVAKIMAHLEGIGNNVGVDSTQLKARSGEKGVLDMNGNSVLLKNLKELMTVWNVMPVLEELKGMTQAAEELKQNLNVTEQMYAEAVIIEANRRIGKALDSNEKVHNEKQSTLYRLSARANNVGARLVLISGLRMLRDFGSNLTKLAGVMRTFDSFDNIKRAMASLILPKPKKDGIRISWAKPQFWNKEEGIKRNWEDYQDVTEFTGSHAYRMLAMFADNFIYEFSKSEKQVKREQRIMGWQDIGPKQQLWMNRFESAFERITGQRFDNEAFKDERGMYRVVFSEAVQRASNAADSVVDAQYGSTSPIRQPLRHQMVLPLIGRLYRNLGLENLAKMTLDRDNAGGVVARFMTNYQSRQHQLAASHMRMALTPGTGLSMKERAGYVGRTFLEVILPSLMYNYTAILTTLAFGSMTATIMGASKGDRERQKILFKQFESMSWWERQKKRVELVLEDSEEELVKTILNSIASQTIDPNTSMALRGVAGYLIYTLWKRDAVVKMKELGGNRQKIDEAKARIREVEDAWFSFMSIRPLEIPLKGGLKADTDYLEAVRRHYAPGKEAEVFSDVIRMLGGFGVIADEVTRLYKVPKLIEASQKEGSPISSSEVYAAALMKAYAIAFAMRFFGGRFGMVASMLSGDIGKLANTIISDNDSKLTGIRIAESKKEKKPSGSGKRRGGRRTIKRRTGRR